MQVLCTDLRIYPLYEKKPENWDLKMETVKKKEVELLSQDNLPAEF